MKEPAAHAQKASSPRELGLLKIQFGGSVRISAGVKLTKKRAQNQKFYSIFFKKSREWKGHEPRCPDFIWTPEKPLAGRTAWPAFPASGKPRFFTGCTSTFRRSASSTFLEGDNLRKLWFRALARNAGHAVRPANNFLRAAKQTGVQQHPKNNPNQKSPDFRPLAQFFPLPPGIICGMPHGNSEKNMVY